MKIINTDTKDKKIIHELYLNEKAVITEKKINRGVPAYRLILLVDRKTDE